LPKTGGRYRTLGAVQQRLRAALRQIDELLVQDSLLKQQVALLEKAAQKAQQFAYHDDLTGLPNRRLLLDHFDQSVARGVRHHTEVAILFLDLDGFKGINDTLGHIVGDTLLRQVAWRLVACLRASDTVCRLGGDEFAILLPDLEGRDGVLAVQAKIRAQLGIPFVIDGASIQITTSVGIAVYPRDGKEYGELLRYADHAMYRDKARARLHGALPAAVHAADDRDGE
jgi:diguanylate cyclase (GGDEF)-like protein